MVDEEHLKQILAERLEKGESLLCLSIPRRPPMSSMIAEVVKGAAVSGGIALVVFLSIWNKYHKLDAARDIAVWGYVVFVIILAIYSVFYFRRNSRVISAITDRAILRIEYKGAISNLNAVTVARTGEFKLDRIPFDTILEVAIRTNSDGSGGIFYSLKAPKNTKAMYDIEVSDVSKVRDALPSNQIRLIDYSATKGN